MFLPSIILAALAFAVSWQISRGNWGARFNGAGALRGTWARSSLAPMRYRVLMPWLLGGLGDAQFLVYALGKLLLMWLLIFFYGSAFGLVPVLWLALAIIATEEFDYWDGYAEALGLVLVLSGRPAGLIAGALVWALSRETVLISPFIALFAHGWPAGLLVGLVAGLALAVMRLWQGPAPHYNQIYHSLVDLNIPDVKSALSRLDKGVILSLGVTVIAPVTLVAYAGRLPDVLTRTAWAAPVWILAAWLMARARETRIMLPAAIWLAALGG